MPAKKKPRKKKATEPKTAEPSGEPEAELCRFVKFEQAIVHRRQLKNAPYNPRNLQEEARAGLKANIESAGLLNGLVWNKRSGHLVSGHQRISILDSLMRTDNYKIPVDVVDLDDKTEREQNVALNNPNITGDYDLQKLGEMFKGGDLDIKSTGFSPAQIYSMFGDNVLSDQPEQVDTLAAQMREARERYNSIKGAIQKRDDPDFYLVVFDGVEARIKFMDSIGIRMLGVVGNPLAYSRFVNGSELKLKYEALQDRIAQLEAELAAAKAS